MFNIFVVISQEKKRMYKSSFVCLVFNILKHWKLPRNDIVRGKGKKTKPKKTSVAFLFFFVLRLHTIPKFMAGAIHFVGGDNGNDYPGMDSEVFYWYDVTLWQ